jgi:hypothetical protein
VSQFHLSLILSLQRFSLFFCIFLPSPSLSLPGSQYRSSFTTKTINAFLIFAIMATRVAHSNILDVPSATMLGQCYNPTVEKLSHLLTRSILIVSSTLSLVSCSFRSLHYVMTALRSPCLWNVINPFISVIQNFGQLRFGFQFFRYILMHFVGFLCLFCISSQRFSFCIFL